MKKIEKSLREIAKLVGGEVIGDADTIITDVSGIKEAQSGDITFIANPKYLSFLQETSASAVIVSREVGEANKPLIRTDDPYLAFTKVMELLGAEEIPHPTGVHPLHVRGTNVRLGRDVAIHAHVVISDDVTIGDNTVLYPGVYLGPSSVIGSDSVVYPRVVIMDSVTIGSRVIIHSGTVVGAYGSFSLAHSQEKSGSTAGVGSVVVEDDVEIGAGVTIDRAPIGATRIKRGTKIDNLVQISHSVEVGENSIIVAQVGIAEGVTIGTGVTLAGQAGVGNHVRIGDRAVVAGKSVVTSDVDQGMLVSGLPAIPHDKEKKIKASLRRLPALSKVVAELRRRIEKLEMSRDD